MSQWAILGNKEKKERLKKGPGDCLLKGKCWVTIKEIAMKLAERRKREEKRTGQVSQGAIPARGVRVTFEILEDGNEQIFWNG